MLVLSRRREEIIDIFPDGDLSGRVIEVFVVEITEGKVRLGITADKKIPVHRREVTEVIRRTKEANDARQGEGETAGEDPPENG